MRHMSGESKDRNGEGTVAPQGDKPDRRGWLQSPDSRIAAAIFALALVVRVVYILQSRSSPAFLMPIVDAEVYDRMARTLAGKHLLEYGFFWQPFFYPFFLAGALPAF